MISFYLSNIELLRKDVSKGQIEINTETVMTIKLDLGFEFEYNVKDGRVSIKFHCAYLLGEDESMPVHYDVLFDYIVNSLSEVLESKEKTKELHLTLIGITYSTLRGIIYMDTRGLKINKLFLPPLSPQELYTRYLEFVNSGKELHSD